MKKLMLVKDYLLELAFLALLVRVVSVGCGIGEALALISVVSSMGYNKWLAKAKITEYEELMSKITSSNEELKDQFNIALGKLNETQVDLDARVSSLAMNKSIRRTDGTQAQGIIPAAAGQSTKRYF